MDKAIETVRQIPVHQVPIKDLYLATEAPKGAGLAVRDSTHAGPLTDAELKASLAHVGLVHPLVFKVLDGRFYVIAGNRRLRLLRDIHKDNTETLIECQNATDYPVDWREIAIDTNLSLPAHPVERYEQMVAIAKDNKMSPNDVRERFGLSQRQYSQIMALGGMAPAIREKWRAGELDFKTAQLFTLEPNHKEQMRLCELVEKQNGGRVYDHVLRMKIVPANQGEAGRMVAFLGVDFCKKNNLIKQEDFFANSHIANDVKQLQRLVDDRLEAKCIELTGKGWGWAIPESKIPSNERWSYQTLPAKGEATKADKAKIKALELEMENHPGDDTERPFEDVEHELEQFQEEANQRRYTDEQKAKTGCILRIGHNGKLQIEYGRMKPSDARKIHASDRAQSKKANAPAKKPGEGSTISSALATRLSEGLQEAIVFAMKEAPQVSVAALIAAAGSGGILLDVRVKDAPSKWEDGAKKDFLQLFNGARTATPAQQIVMLTRIAMQALSIVTQNPLHRPLDDKTLQALVSNLNAGVVNRLIAEHFEAEDYFKGVSLETIAGAVRCAVSDDLADKVAKMKKADAVKVAVEQLPKKGWLPIELRTVHYKGPTEKAAPRKEKAPAAEKAKPAKAAPAKKAANKKGKK